MNEAPRQQEILEKIIEMGTRQRDAVESQARLQEQLGSQEKAVLDLLRQAETKHTENSAQLRENLLEKIGDGDKRTQQAVSTLNERLARIDEFQKQLQQQTEQLVSLEDILSNKQLRGRFGEIMLENLLRDSLPPSMVEFQKTLSTGARVDCLITLPNGALVVDSKFPLESAERLWEGDEASRKKNSTQLATALRKHIDDVARYVAATDTQDVALIYIPSDSVFSTIGQHAPEIFKYGRAKRVFIASPLTMMVIIENCQLVVRDASFSENLRFIRDELGKVEDDTKRLIDRVANMKKHYEQLGKDFHEVETSSGKIHRRAETMLGSSRLEQVENALAPQLASPQQQKLLGSSPESDEAS